MFPICVDVQAAPRKAQEALFDEVVQCGLSLMQDQYGNYVVQYTIDRAGSEFLAKLTKSVAGYVGRCRMSSSLSSFMFLHRVAHTVILLKVRIGTDWGFCLTLFFVAVLFKHIFSFVVPAKIQFQRECVGTA